MSVSSAVWCRRWRAARDPVVRDAARRRVAGVGVFVPGRLVSRGRVVAIAAGHLANGAPVHRRTHAARGARAEPDPGAVRGDLRGPALGSHRNEFTIDLFRELIVPTLLPIIVLLPATAAFGNELEDGTLPYLLMKPVSRLRLILGKYAAVLLVTVPALLAGLAVTTAIATRTSHGIWDESWRRWLARQPPRRRCWPRSFCW